jgi:NAD(P)-dependent dehydrogenase (short-subunit alcohol dehydrogenase family)
MDGQVAGQVAVVTGGGRGFGRAIALALAAEGAFVAITARSQEQLQATIALAGPAGERMLAVPGDVRDAEHMQTAAEVARKRFGAIDLAVHSAGIVWAFGPLWQVDAAKWWYEQEVHLLGSLHLVQATAPGMIERGGGRVILVSSQAGVRLMPNASGYGVSKTSQNRMAAFLAAEGREHRICAFAIHPGGGLYTQLVDDIVASPDAQRWIPGFVESVHAARRRNDDPSITLRRCGELCLALASGRYDALSGHFLTPDDDLDTLLAATSNRPTSQPPPG